MNEAHDRKLHVLITSSEITLVVKATSLYIIVFQSTCTVIRGATMEVGLFRSFVSSLEYKRVE